MKYLICYFDSGVSRMFVEKAAEDGTKVASLSSPHNFFYRGEVVAKAVTVEDPVDVELEADKSSAYHKIEKNTGFKAGDGILYDQSAGSYNASEYGFAVLDNNTQKLRLITPLQVSKDKVRAYFIVFPTRTLKIPTYKDIEEALQKRRILAIMSREDIEEQLGAIDASKPKVSRILVARGKEPVNGHAEYFVPLMNLEKKVGRVLEDGRIDFKELESIIEIKKGQEILRRMPEVKAQDGMDIYGEKVDATIEAMEGYFRGDNVVEAAGGEGVFVSEVDGCLSVDRKKISVSPFAIIRGDVDYDTGNIDFNGSVHIMGSVLPGFSVKARGDIIIDKNADDAYIEAGGDVTVKQGIAGKGSMKVVAGGQVRAKFMLNAEVEAVKEIEVEDSIINSRVFSNDRILVTARHGKIIGGETKARHEIVANVAGVPKENLTMLSAGVSLFVERELLEIRKEIEAARGTISNLVLKIKTSYGDGLFEDPKKFLTILPPVKKKACLELLKELTDLNKELNRLSQEKAESEAKFNVEREPVIIITESVFPGTIIHIKKRRRKIEEKMVNVKFYEDPEDKEIRFTTAV